MQIIPGRDVQTGNRKARRVIRQCTFVGAVVAIGIGAVGTFGADLDTSKFQRDRRPVAARAGGSLAKPL